jgi:hypothetical protein
MANDDRQSEQFIREVDEEFRRAQLKAVWDRFAPLIIGTCVIIVAVTAGYRGYVWWQERQAAEAGDRYMAALTALESGNTAEAEADLAAIAEEGAGGYPALARLGLAGAKAEAGEGQEAITAYDQVAADSGVAPALRDLARVRAGLIALDMRDFAGATERVAPLNNAGNPWRHTAREILGTAAYASGDPAGAREIFTEIQQDAETPADLWARSGLMISLIDGRIAAPDNGADGAAATSDTAPLANAEEPAVTSPDDLESGVRESAAEPADPAPQNAIPPQ